MRPTLGQRDLFPTLEPLVYANHAAVSPLATPVRQAALDAMDDCARRGVGAVVDALDDREVLRREVAEWLGAHPADIGFPPGTTRGIVDLALALPWRTGDRIVVFAGEFPSNVLPWKTVAQRFDLELVTLPIDAAGGIDHVRAALPARLVAVSAVQFSTGLRMPLPELARLTHAGGGELFVDAIQALGVVPVHCDEGFDYLVAGTHKWLMGLEGLAVAYAAPEARARLRPLTGGWLSREDPVGFLFEPDRLRYDRPLRSSLDWVEGGVQTTAAFAALSASTRMLRDLGIDAIFAHVQAWHDAVEPALVKRGFTSGRAAYPEGRSGSLCLRPPSGTSLPELAAHLASRGVSISTPDGWLRLSPHWPNDVQRELPILLEAIDHALRG
jgi:cysteine desulfurase/selenocysteine lyase